MAKYTMKSRGGTRGAITGKLYNWQPGQEIDAPEKEFDHLGGGDFEVKKAARKTTKKKTAATGQVPSENREITSEAPKRS